MVLSFLSTQPLESHAVQNASVTRISLVWDVMCPALDIVVVWFILNNCLSQVPDFSLAACLAERVLKLDNHFVFIQILYIRICIDPCCNVLRFIYVYVYVFILSLPYVLLVLFWLEPYNFCIMFLFYPSNYQSVCKQIYATTQTSLSIVSTSPTWFVFHLISAFLYPVPNGLKPVLCCVVVIAYASCWRLRCPFCAHSAFSCNFALWSHCCVLWQLNFFRIYNVSLNYFARTSVHSEPSS